MSRQEKYDRLRDIAEHIIDNPRSVDGDAKAALVASTRKYAAMLHHDLRKGLEIIYHDQRGIGRLVRKAAEIVGDAEDEDRDEINKAHRDRRGAGGPHSLTGALLDHLHDRLERRREQHGFEKANTEKEQPAMSLIKSFQDVAKTHGYPALSRSQRTLSRSRKASASRRRSFASSSTPPPGLLIQSLGRAPSKKSTNAIPCWRRLSPSSRPGSPSSFLAAVCRFRLSAAKMRAP